RPNCCCTKARAGWPPPMPTAACPRTGSPSSWPATPTPSAAPCASPTGATSPRACAPPSSPASTTPTTTRTCTAPTSACAPRPTARSAASPRCPRTKTAACSTRWHAAASALPVAPTPPSPPAPAGMREQDTASATTCWRWKRRCEQTGAPATPAVAPLLLPAPADHPSRRLRSTPCPARGALRPSWVEGRGGTLFTRPAFYSFHRPRGTAPLTGGGLGWETPYGPAFYSLPRLRGRAGVGTPQHRRPHWSSAGKAELSALRRRPQPHAGEIHRHRQRHIHVVGEQIQR